MNNMLLTSREICQRVVEENNAFYCVETTIRGYKAEIYNYRLAAYTDFYPTGLEGPNYTELRGLTFIYNPDTNEWEKHLALGKFFNCNQTTGYDYNTLKNLKITGLADKCDGSMITFIKLPNSEVVAKTKTSFVSPQAKLAQTIYENDLNYKTFIDYMIDTDVLIFEIVSPFNQIVLNYNDTELRLLQVRDKNTGEYASSKAISDWSEDNNLKYSFQYNAEDYTLDNLLDLKKTEENIEGWVVTTPIRRYKVKTDWYMQLHGLVTEGTRENLLIKTILDKNIDDVIAQIDGQKKDFILKIEKQVTKKFNDLVIKFKTLRKKYFNEFEENRKEFAIAYSKDELFKYVIKTINHIDSEELAEEQVKLFIEKQTYSLNDAKKWLEGN